MRIEQTNRGTFRQIRRGAAARMFKEGITIYMIPCKCRFNFGGTWIRPYDVNIANEDGASLESIAANYEYYNCVSELGRYAIFFYEERFVLKCANGYFRGFAGFEEGGSPLFTEIKKDAYILNSATEAINLKKTVAKRSKMRITTEIA